MAKLYADLSGTIVRASLSDAADSSWGPPSTATNSLSFDESTNTALITDVQANLGQYSIVNVAGVATLQKNGATVTIAAPSALYSLQNTILNGIPDATLKSSIIALWNGTATSAQQQKALAYCLLKLHQAGAI